MAAADQVHVPRLASLPLHRLLMHLRVVAVSRRHTRLLHRIDDAIDAVVETAELERCWTDHQLRQGQIFAHPLARRAEAASAEHLESDEQLDPTEEHHCADHLDGMLGTLPQLDDARARHHRVVRRLLLAIDHHPSAWRYLKAIHRWAPARWKKGSSSAAGVHLVWSRPASR